MDEWQDALTPRQFEELVADLLREEGYQAVRVVGQTGDQGVDITCIDGDGRLVVVQCKKYKSTSAIGAPEIRTFFGVVVAKRAARGIYTTTGRFTEPAVRHAQQNDIELIDEARLARYYGARARTRSNQTQSIEAPTLGGFFEFNFITVLVWDHPSLRNLRVLGRLGVGREDLLSPRTHTRDAPAALLHLNATSR